MRFVHTADWHIGRQLHGTSLIEDQAWWLDRFVELVDAEKPDAVVIAGDVYDRAVPPADAVALLDDAITRIVRDLEVPVMLVAGNHDSPERLGFGARMFAKAGLHVAGELAAHVVSVVVGEGADATRFWLLPYADAIETRGVLGRTDIHDHEAAVGACIETIRHAGATEPRQVLVTHHFVAGGVTSDSERGLTVGGTGAVSASLFEGFHFVALGHLHRRQTIDGRIHYPGSALKYAFDESKTTKAVSIVDLRDDGAEIRSVELGARRDVRRVEGGFDEVLAHGPFDDHRDDYVEVILSDAVMPPDALGRLREFYPNLLNLTRSADAFAPDSAEAPETRNVERLTDEELYQRFFAAVTGDDLPDELRETLHELLQERAGGER